MCIANPSARAAGLRCRLPALGERSRRCNAHRASRTPPGKGATAGSRGRNPLPSQGSTQSCDVTTVAGPPAAGAAHGTRPPPAQDRCRRRAPRWASPSRVEADPGLRGSFKGWRRAELRSQLFAYYANFRRHDRQCRIHRCFWARRLPATRLGLFARGRGRLRAPLRWQKGASYAPLAGPHPSRIGRGAGRASF